MSANANSNTAPPRDLKPLYVFVWFLCSLFYLYQYAARSAPGVMQDQLTAAWGGNHIGSMISAYYSAYAVTALAAVEMQRDLFALNLCNQPLDPVDC
jgi:hypothetical protein